ncbi:AAA family ATPase [Kribbella sp. CA-293567]|uniref:AAA family ATPase n=1 Tax=Kribbella sp. CA-293567 TaxID=3002436 RepID=UPI0022DE85CD|nr:AAA family ATPase [Kribbella sp. CA-293567]WBQ08583.1 AAA family ATPase [Kribbella sp. CA-293567]
MLISPRVREDLDTTEFRYPSNSLVVLAGIPGAGKSTLLRRLFPDPTGDVRVLDSEPIRNRWKPVLRSVPYAVWRPLLHVTYYAQVLRAIRTEGPLVIHDCATKPLARQLIGRAAKLAGRPVHLIMLDVPAEVAKLGQRARDRVVREGSMETHSRRWPVLRDLAVTTPGRVVPGAASAVILTRDQANQLAGITFRP